MSLPAIRSGVDTVHRRTRHYVDHSVQRALLISMVALEVVLVAASVWLAYARLASFIDASMYRMMLSQSGPTLLRLAQEAMPVLGGFVALNLIALSAVAAIWSRRKRRVLRSLGEMMEKTRALDFSPDTEPEQQHEVLALAAAWRARERERFRAVRECVAQLEAAWSAAQPAQELRDHTARLSHLLA
jgi:hypothetical protein